MSFMARWTVRRQAHSAQLLVFLDSDPEVISWQTNNWNKFLHFFIHSSGQPHWRTVQRMILKKLGTCCHSIAVHWLGRVSSYCIIIFLW
jgi:hypothetical protein